MRHQRNRFGPRERATWLLFCASLLSLAAGCSTHTECSDIPRSSRNGPARPQPVGDESYGRACIFRQSGQWKARWTEPPFGPLDGHWELFFVALDRGETVDLAPYLPSVVDGLSQQWQTYMTSVGGVEPLLPYGYY